MFSDTPLCAGWTEAFMEDGKGNVGVVDANECKIFGFDLNQAGNLSYTTMTRFRDQFQRLGWLHEHKWIMEELARRKCMKLSDKDNEHLKRTKQDKIDLLEAIPHFKVPSVAERKALQKEVAGTVDPAVVKQREAKLRTIQKKKDNFQSGDVALKKKKN